MTSKLWTPLKLNAMHAMKDVVENSRDSNTWLDRLGDIYLLVPAVMLAVAMLPLVAVLAGLGLCSVSANYVGEVWFQHRMRRARRFLSIAQVHDRIADCGGTLIIESPSFGWKYSRAWWTPVDVQTQSPFKTATLEDYQQGDELKCLDWDRWCWNNFTSPETGGGFLLRVWNGKSVEGKLKEDFPDLVVVGTWTALVHLNEPNSFTG